MTSEKRLREIAAQEVRDLSRYQHHSDPLWEDYPDLTEGEWMRVVHLIDTYPILNLPVPDRDGLWWPTAPTLGYVQRTGFTIHAIGGLVRLDLTRDEALDLAAILTAAATEEA